MIAQRRARYAGFSTRELSVAGTAPTIVLLHGFSHSAHCWRPVLQRLDRVGRAAVAVDLPGFGVADPIRGGSWLAQSDEFVADLTLRYGDCSPVVLAGNSLGGLLALRAAASAESPIRGVLSVDAAGTGWAPLLRLANADNLRLLELLVSAPVPAVVRQAVANVASRVLMYGKWSAADPQLLRLLSLRLRSRADAAAVIADAATILAEVESMPPLGHIDCPTTVLQGRRDLLVSVQAARRLHREIPHSKLVILDGIGHCPQLDAPDIVVALATELAVGSATAGAAYRRRVPV